MKRKKNRDSEENWSYKHDYPIEVSDMEMWAIITLGIIKVNHTYHRSKSSESPKIIIRIIKNNATGGGNCSYAREHQSINWCAPNE
jgi:hypothetical protein